MKHRFIFHSLTEFAAGIVLHDSDVHTITLDKTGAVLWLDGVFFPENSPANDIAPYFAYGFPARILFSEAKLCPIPEDHKFFALKENEQDYFEIITVTYNAEHILLEGQFYTNNGCDITGIDPSDHEASLEIHTTGTITVEWEDVCKEG